MAAHLIPVEACSGWLNPCCFCDKRFSEWFPILEDEDSMTTIPTKPGVFMFAFTNKRGKETVIIGVHKVNVQTPIMSHLQELRRQVSEKKLKETKTSILLRYLVVEDVINREACSIYAHWYNYGILPRFTNKWPGLRSLENSTDFEYSEESNKWCHPAKDPVWRKQKIKTIPQDIPKCKGWTENCSYCDEKFTVWLPADEAVCKKESEGGAPESSGFCLYSASKKGGQREILYLSVIDNIKADIKFVKPWVCNSIRYSLPKGFDPTLIQVRWSTVKDLQDMECYFLYAHFLNFGKAPALNRDLPGDTILANNKKFVFCQRNKQWCYDEGQTIPLKTTSRTKERRNMLLSALEDLHT